MNFGQQQQAGVWELDELGVLLGTLVAELCAEAKGGGG